MPFHRAFGFLGNEMASFYTCDAEWNQDEEIALFDMGGTGSDVRLMNESFLEDVLTEETPKLIYVYDFFSMWTFFVELADIVEERSGKVIPQPAIWFWRVTRVTSTEKFQGRKPVL